MKTVHTFIDAELSCEKAIEESIDRLEIHGIDKSCLMMVVNPEYAERLKSEKKYVTNDRLGPNALVVNDLYYGIEVLVANCKPMLISKYALEKIAYNEPLHYCRGAIDILSTRHS